MQRFVSTSSIQSIDSYILRQAEDPNELVKQLQQERAIIQKKTFSNWCNTILGKYDSIVDLFEDFRDGVKLIRLLEIVSRKKVGKVTKGRMRIHYMQNLQLCMRFLEENGVPLKRVSTGAEDIADGNERLTLGMIWLIILHFHLMVAIQIEGSSDYKSLKNALLLWCQNKTQSHPEIEIRNFSSSWKSGLAFNAIIEHFHPNLINYSQLPINNPIACIENAFQVSQDNFDIARLLDAEDVAKYADEKSLVTYISQLYNYFSKMKQQGVGKERLTRILQLARERHLLCNDYEQKASEFLTTISRQKTTFSETKFDQLDLILLQNILETYKGYISKDKENLIILKSSLDDIYSDILIKCTAHNFVPYIPPKLLSLETIKYEWELLSTLELDYRTNLLSETRREEYLRRCIRKYEKVSKSCHNWLKEQFKLVKILPEREQNEADLLCTKLAKLFIQIQSFDRKLAVLNKAVDKLIELKYKDIEKIITDQKSLQDQYNQLVLEVEGRQLILKLSRDYASLQSDTDSITQRIAVVASICDQHRTKGFWENEDQVFLFILELSSFKSQLSSLIDSTNSISVQLEPYARNFDEARICIDWIKSLIQILNQTGVKIDDLKSYMTPYYKGSGKIQIEILASNILEDTQTEITDLENKTKQLHGQKPENLFSRILELNKITLNCKTIESRMIDLLPESKERKYILIRTGKLLDLCDNLRLVCYNDGWLIAVLSELDYTLTYLKGAEYKIKSVDSILKSPKKLSHDEYINLGVISKDVENCQSVIQSLVSESTHELATLPQSPDFTNHPAVLARCSQINQLLNTLSTSIQIIEAKLNEDTTGMDVFSWDPLITKQWLDVKQKWISEIDTQSNDPNSIAFQTLKLRHIKLALDHFSNLNPPKEQIEDLPVLISDCEAKYQNIQSKQSTVEITALLHGTKFYIDNKQNIYKKMKIDFDENNLPIETKLKILNLINEIENYQKHLNSKINLNLESVHIELSTKSEIRELQLEVNNLMDNFSSEITEFIKLKDHESKENEMINSAIEFITWCENIAQPISLEVLQAVPLNNDSIREILMDISNRDYEIKSRLATFDQLFDLYQSGSAKVREKAKEMQRNWQNITQYQDNSQTHSKLLQFCLDLNNKILPFEKPINLMLNEKFPKLQQDISKTSTIDEIKSTLTDVTILYDICTIIKERLNSPNINTFVQSSIDLLGQELTNQYIMPKVDINKKNIETIQQQFEELKNTLNSKIDFYDLDERYKSEKDWAENALNELKIHPNTFEIYKRHAEIFKWAEHLKSSWIESNTDAYSSYPKHMEIILTENMTNIGTMCQQILELQEELKNWPYITINQRAIDDAFREKIDKILSNLETENLSDTPVKIDVSLKELKRLSDYLELLSRKLKKKSPNSELLVKFPEAQNQIDERIRRITLRLAKVDMLYELETHFAKTQEIISNIDNYAASIDTKTLNELEEFKARLKLIQLENASTTKDIESYNDIANQPDNEDLLALDKLEQLHSLQTELENKLNETQIQVSQKSEYIRNGLAYEEALETLAELDFNLETDPRSDNIRPRKSVANFVLKFISDSSQFAEKLSEITSQVSALNGKFADIDQNQMETAKLEDSKHLIEYFKTWLEPKLSKLEEIAQTETVSNVTLVELNYVLFVLTTIAPKIHCELSNMCPISINLVQELTSIWPIPNRLLECKPYIEMRSELQQFLISSEEASSTIYGLRDQIPSKDKGFQNLLNSKVWLSFSEFVINSAKANYDLTIQNSQSILEKHELSESQIAQVNNAVSMVKEAYDDIMSNCLELCELAKQMIDTNAIQCELETITSRQLAIEKLINSIESTDSEPIELPLELEKTIEVQEKACNEALSLIANLSTGETAKAEEDINKALDSLNNAKLITNRIKMGPDFTKIMNILNKKYTTAEEGVQVVEATEDIPTLQKWLRWVDYWEKIIENLIISEEEGTVSNIDQMVAIDSEQILSSEIVASDSHIDDTDLEPPQTNQSPDSPLYVGSLKDEYLTSQQETQLVQTSEPPLSLEEQFVETERKSSLPPLKYQEPIHEDVQLIPRIYDPSELEIEFKSPYQTEKLIKQPIELPQTQSTSASIEKDEINAEIIEQEIVSEMPDQVAHQIVKLPEIDGDPARPSPVHVYKNLFPNAEDTNEMKELDSILEEIYLDNNNNINSNDNIEINETSNVAVVSNTEQSKIDFEELPKSDATTRTQITTETVKISSIESVADLSVLQESELDKEVLEKHHGSFSQEIDVISFIKSMNTPISKEDLSAQSASVVDTQLQENLNRKQDTVRGGKRAPKLSRSWKNYFTVLRMTQMDFYKDSIDIQLSNTAIASLPLVNAVVEKPTDYVKRNFVFRITIPNGASYLFQTKDESNYTKWFRAVQYTIQNISDNQLVTTNDSTLSLNEDNVKKQSFKTFFSKN